MPGERCPACMKPVGTGASQCPSCGEPIPCEPNPPESLQPGYVLGNRFMIGKVIGRGENSISYIAYDNRLQAVRRIKEFFPRNYTRRQDLSPEIPPNRESEFKALSARFLREAQIMSGMYEEKVSNVVRVFDRIHQNGTNYILMEYLDGCTLEDWIVRNRQGLSWDETAKIMQSVLQTLEEIHRRGYLHRDLCLKNIFRTQDGSIRIIDFGSAEAGSTAKSHPEKMLPFSRKHYSPVEQVSNGRQGPWTDVYTAGTCMFRMLAGGWPSFQKNTEPFPALRPLGLTIPQAADQIIIRATQPDPKKRFATAEAMRDALNKAAAEKPQIRGILNGLYNRNR